MVRLPLLGALVVAVSSSLDVHSLPGWPAASARRGRLEEPDGKRR